MHFGANANRRHIAQEKCWSKIEMEDGKNKKKIQRKKLRNVLHVARSI